jgi:hypothetical protein
MIPATIATLMSVDIIVRPLRRVDSAFSLDLFKDFLREISPSAAGCSSGLGPGAGATVDYVVKDAPDDGEASVLAALPEEIGEWCGRR